MASVALDPAYRRVSVREFLDMDFGDARAELIEGLIYMMAGGTEEHARVAGNVFASLHRQLRGTGCRPYGSDFATRTGEDTVRLPDISVHCDNPTALQNRHKQLLGDPVAVFEVLSPSTASQDHKVKLEEYRSLAGTREVVLIDPGKERIRHARRNADGDWIDGWLSEGADLYLQSLAVTVSHADIFAID